MDRLLDQWEFWVGNFYLETSKILIFYKIMRMKVSLSTTVSTPIREFDLVTIGKGLNIDGKLFPRILRTKRIYFGNIEIKDFVTVKGTAIVHPNVMENYSTVERMTVIRKGTNLPERSR
jgi:hypothetical protein